MTTDIELEQYIFGRLQAVDQAWRGGYAEAGILCRQIYDKHLWKHRATSFEAYVKLACPFGSSMAYSALRDIRALADIPDADLAQMPAPSISVLKQLSTAVRARPEVIEVAKTKPASELVGYIRANHADQHLENNVTLRFTLDEGASATIEKGLSLAMQMGASNKSEALEWVFVEWIAVKQYEKEVEKVASERV